MGNYRRDGPARVAGTYHVAMNETHEQWVRVISYESLPGSHRPGNALRA
jgi:hypothetical protein